MGRKNKDSEPFALTNLALVLVGIFFCAIVYGIVSVLVTQSDSNDGKSRSDYQWKMDRSLWGTRSDQCCKGIDKLELWGKVVSFTRASSPEECCNACKRNCSGWFGRCLCHAWVFCGHKKSCGTRYGECWLKEQKNVMFPEEHESGVHVMWTSGINFGKGEGMVGLKTTYGTIRIQLLSNCAPLSVSIILDGMKLGYCERCYFYRAERRGDSWDEEGNHVELKSYGPPYALIQGVLNARGSLGNGTTENPRRLTRGSVAWIGAGPDFIISLADHREWGTRYSVFATVLAEDMWVAEKIANLPTKTQLWNGVEVSSLPKPIPFTIQRARVASK